MIGATGDVAYSGNRGAVDQSRRADAVGQLAKEAVSSAREAGTALPKNAQGVAASGIARGADPASIFAALVAPVEEPGDAPDAGGVTTTPPQEGIVDDAPIDTLVPNPVETDTPSPAPSEEVPLETVALQVAVSEPILSVDDGAVAVELLSDTTG